MGSNYTPVTHPSPSPPRLSPLHTHSLAHPSPIPMMLPGYGIFPQPGPAQPSPALPCLALFQTPGAVFGCGEKKKSQFHANALACKGKVSRKFSSCVHAGVCVERTLWLEEESRRGQKYPCPLLILWRWGSGRSIALSCRAARPNSSLRPPWPFLDSTDLLFLLRLGEKTPKQNK